MCPGGATACCPRVVTLEQQYRDHTAGAEGVNHLQQQREVEALRDEMDKRFDKVEERIGGVDDKVDELRKTVWKAMGAVGAIAWAASLLAGWLLGKF